MGENGIPTIAAPRDRLIDGGIPPDQLGDPLPKRDRAWECNGEGIVLLRAPARLGGYYYSKLSLFYYSVQKHRKDSTKSIRTPEGPYSLRTYISQYMMHEGVQ